MTRTQTAPKDQKKGRAQKSVTLKISEERLKRLRNQNAKLGIDVKRLKGELMPVDDLKREVIKANLTVKTHLLGIPARLATRLSGMTDPWEIEQTLRYEIEQALNDLAHGFGANEPEGDDAAA